MTHRACSRSDVEHCSKKAQQGKARSFRIPLRNTAHRQRIYAPDLRGRQGMILVGASQPALERHEGVATGPAQHAERDSWNGSQAALQLTRLAAVPAAFARSHWNSEGNNFAAMLWGEPIVDAPVVDPQRPAAVIQQVSEQPCGGQLMATKAGKIVSRCAERLLRSCALLSAVGAIDPAPAPRPPGSNCARTRA